MPTTPQAWDQQSGETPRAFAAFTAYRDLPPGQRSLDAAWHSTRGQQGGERGATRAPSSWQRWSRDHRWVERATAWDHHADQRVQEQIITTRTQAVHRALEAVELIERVAIASLQLELPMPPSDAGRLLLNATRARVDLTAPTVALDTTRDTLDQVVEHLAARVAAGDMTAAGHLHRFMERQAARDGTDTPPDVESHTWVDGIFGPGGPDAIPPHLKAEVLQHLRAAAENHEEEQR